jgi:pyruvate,water dikinase
MSKESSQYIKWFEDLSSDDVSIVGGKNASLGEMIRGLKNRGVSVPDGFATTAEAYRKYLEENEINEKMDAKLKDLKKDGSNLSNVGKSIRMMFRKGEFPNSIADEIISSYNELRSRNGDQDITVAVRSSATAEDLPNASFAGQQETYLNVSGEEDLLEACKSCYASLFTNRAISYREEKGFDHKKVALSIGVQRMVRSDKAGSGVMFSIDTETGFKDMVVINAAWGLGENVVQGSINPDEYQVFKPLLGADSYNPIIDKNLGDKEKKMVYARSSATKNINTTKKERRSFVLEDKEILTLAEWAVEIEKHYEKAMDIEWAKDGKNGKLYIVQARPETVQSQKEAGSMKAYELKEQGKEILSGLSIGEAIASGKAQVIKDADDIDKFKDGSILITGMTDPDWVPIMKKAAGIVTDYGGRTSHAAIVSRELGIPAVVGTEEATEKIDDKQEITISCTDNERGVVYEGILEFEESTIDLEEIPETKTKIKMNIASPGAAFRWWRLPADGIGLARMEFIINNVIKIHPLALLHYDDLEDKDAKKTIRDLTKMYDSKPQYFIDHLARGIAKIAASQYPKQVIVRMSDFKSNEYADLIGGKQFEPDEENPMLGFRGASRYYSEKYREAFALECKAIRKVREEIGMENVAIMIPFCRTVEEADKILAVLSDYELERGRNALKIYVMCEIPSNVILAEEFAERFDGFSIGSNDLTQLVLGVDRDSAELSSLFDERNDAVKNFIAQLIRDAHKHDCEVGICGQAPSDYLEFAEFLVREGIDSISLNPDSVINTIKCISNVEKGQDRD